MSVFAVDPNSPCPNCKLQDRVPICPVYKDKCKYELPEDKGKSGKGRTAGVAEKDRELE